MAESVTQPEILRDDQHNHTSISTTTATSRDTDKTASRAPEQTAYSSDLPVIIWVPRFIILFALTLVFGLSLASILVLGWTHGYYPADAVFLGYILPVSGCWLAVLLRAKDPWIRLGAVFGVTWSLLNITDYSLSLLGIDPNSPVFMHLYAAASSAFLGASLSFAIARMPVSQWDVRFFRIAPFFWGIVVVLFYFRAPAESRSFMTLERAIALSALGLSLLIWWLRPSCWKTQPGPTFLFGVIPFLLLIFRASWNSLDEATFFFTQVMLLSMLLGAMRILQGELRHRSYRSPQHLEDAMQGEHDYQRAQPVVEQVQNNGGPD
ncbi:MAG: hypothetical protein IMW89_19770 [Ktedonobacteraceae bacterium]|nr:hypothetical protein [Ktedonobacteraceae bacterium]